jgi:hypothetical protein
MVQTAFERYCVMPRSGGVRWLRTGFLHRSMSTDRVGTTTIIAHTAGVAVLIYNLYCAAGRLEAGQWFL